ncbi:unnamed protein product [Moneuplotes crassus]|uniref:Uncharacterized protein n=1 Tax=Euplotes crassus TaxID=5936 RepID=A0AAD1X997_EUPCR|nr:unnamed protein product [Moneuplotes crassus]
MSDFKYPKRGRSALDNYKTTEGLTVDSYGDQYSRIIAQKNYNQKKNSIKCPKKIFKNIKKNATSKDGRKSCLNSIDKDTYQIKGKSRNKGKTYMKNKYTLMSDKILNTISNRRDIRIPIQTGKFKASKKANNSRNGISSLRSGSSNSNRVSDFNQYITMLSNGLPYGQRNKMVKRINSKSNKKVKKCGSRCNSSALSVYKEHQTSLLKNHGKENLNDTSLNSYSNVPIFSSQFQTLNNSMLNSRDFEGKFSDGRQKSRSNKSRIKTTSTNSHFNAEKLLESEKKRKQTSLTRINTFKNTKKIENKSKISSSFHTLDSKMQRQSHIDKKSIEKIRVYLEDGKKLIAQRKFVEAIGHLTKALKLIDTNCSILFQIQNPKDSHKELQSTLHKHPSYKQLAYLVLAMAYKQKENDLEIIEKFSDIYLARAHIYLYLKKYHNALSDFRIFSLYSLDRTAGHLGEGDALKKLGKMEEAVKCYTRIITDEGLKHNRNPLYKTAIERRAITYFVMKEYLKSKADFETIHGFEESTIKANYYIGKIYTKLDDTNSAILHFEQVLKFSDEKYFSGNALYEMAKIRIKQKNFYEASFTLQRAIDKDFKSKRLILYKEFTEGVLYLIKRQGDKGVELLTDLLKKLDEVDQTDRKIMGPTISVLTHSSYTYRAYGHLFNGNHKEGYDDLIEAKSFGHHFERASEYNLTIAEGVLATESGEEYTRAHDLFELCKSKFPDNKDPYLLQSLNIILKCFRDNHNQWIDDDFKKETLINAKGIVDQAIDSNCKLDSVIYYYRGLLHYYLHSFYEALLDFEMAIDKDDEPGASLYLARGRSFACLSMLNEAIKDFSIAINLDEKCTDAYLCRGKCSYLVGNNTQAFMDFQKLIVLDAKNPKVHIHAGNLLMTTGAYLDATKAYLNADVVEKTAEAAFHRGRCYAALTELDEAVSEIKKVVELSSEEKLSFPDLDCLEILRNLTVSSGKTGKATEEQSESNCTPKSQEIPLNGAEQRNEREIILDISLDDEVLDLSIKAMDKLIDFFNPQKSSFDSTTNPIYQFKKCESPLSIQIIPNVNRVRLEKARAVSAIQERKCSLHELIEECKHMKEDDHTGEFDTISYYRENIFNLEDYYLYRGVMRFYNQDYQKAIKDFEISSRIKSINKSYQKATKSDPKSSNMSSQTDLSDIGLCSFNSNETYFNILLCYLCKGDIDKSIEYANKLIESVPQRYKSKLYLIRGLCYQEKELFDLCKKDFMKSYTNNPELSSQCLDLEGEVLIEPFETNNRLCSKFPHVKLKISNTIIFSRPSFSIPFIKPPNMIPNVDEIQMQKELTLKHLGGIKPEAPWIKRCDFGIKFTDEIQENDFKIEQESNHEQNDPFESPAPKEKSPESCKGSPMYVKRALSEQVIRATDYRY